MVASAYACFGRMFGLDWLPRHVTTYLLCGLGGDSPYWLFGQSAADIVAQAVHTNRTTANVYMCCCIIITVLHL